MPAEVIDLLSSPELPKPVVRKPSAREDAPTVSRANPPARSLNDEPRKQSDKDWLMVLSDSSDDLDKGGGEPIPIVPSKTSGKLKPSSNTTTKPQPLQTSKYSSAVYLQSDDFDSTFNLDDPFELEVPPAKKRRLSSSPQALPPKPKLLKTSQFKRSISNIEYSSNRGAAYKSSAHGLKISKTVLDSDPILFTSLPDPFEDAARRRREKRMVAAKDDEDDDVFQTWPAKKKKTQSHTNILAVSSDDDGDIFRLLPAKKRKPGNNIDPLDESDKSSEDSELPELDDVIAAGPSKSSSKTKAKSMLDDYNTARVKERRAEEKAKKSGERLASQQTKRANKEAEKERKRLEREEKAQEKDRIAELARVNIVRTNKQRSSHEMIVDLPSKLSESELIEQVRKLLGKAEIKHSDWESSLPVIKWRREVTAAYNDEMGQWEPVAPHTKTEGHIMFVMSAKEFVELATGEEGKDIDSHVLGLKAKFPSSKIIYLIEGLMVWMRKNKTIQNRKFTEMVRNQTNQSEPAASQRPKKKKQEEYIDEDLVEDALLRLQVMHKTLIHHTAAMIETAEWILVFTQHISTIPYRLQEQSLDTTFCMASGQVKSGENASDTFVKMLQELKLLTAAAAQGIAAEYPSVQKLVQGLQDNGPLALEDCRKTAGNGGAFTDRRVGPAVSRRVYKVFTGREEMSVSV